MREQLGRNDLCYCGSNKKYKDCHLKPFYPTEYFDATIKEFEDIRFENKASNYISIGRVDVYYKEPHPWDNEISGLLKPLTEVLWNQEGRWQNRIKNRIDKLRHKLDAIQYHAYLFRAFEHRTKLEKIYRRKYYYE